jgi:hypothetical protein
MTGHFKVLILKVGKVSRKLGCLLSVDKRSVNESNVPGEVSLSSLRIGSDRPDRRLPKSDRQARLHRLLFANVNSLQSIFETISHIIAKMSKARAAQDVIVKLIVGAGQASPSPPVGPALGSKGVKSMDFCKVGFIVPPFLCQFRPL